MKKKGKVLIMSDMLTILKANEDEIDDIINTLRKSVFEELDRKKEELKKEDFDYEDFAWKYSMRKSEWHWNLEDCCFVYRRKYETITYQPFCVSNYLSGSPERELVEKLYKEHKDEKIMQIVMATLLLQWMKKEESARTKEELERRAQNIREYLDECKIIADEYGISVDTVLLSELKEELNAFSKEFCLFKKQAAEKEEWMNSNSES